MRAMVFSIGLVVGPSVLWADVQDIMNAAHSAFEDMPALQLVEQISGSCGADRHVNQGVAYCTSDNVVYLSAAVSDHPKAAYLVAHVMGHAAQVRHGVADLALAAIRANPEDERSLRGEVTRQVECLAGLYFTLAEIPQSALSDWFDEEPFTGSHWGRNPLRIGPRVSIGLAERDVWFQKGQASQNPTDCSVGVLSADLLESAFRR